MSEEETFGRRMRLAYDVLLEGGEELPAELWERLMPHVERALLELQETLYIAGYCPHGGGGQHFNGCGCPIAVL